MLAYGVHDQAYNFVLAPTLMEFFDKIAEAEILVFFDGKMLVGIAAVSRADRQTVISAFVVEDDIRHIAIAFKLDFRVIGDLGFDGLKRGSILSYRGFRHKSLRSGHG